MQSPQAPHRDRRPPAHKPVNQRVWAVQLAARALSRDAEFLRDVSDRPAITRSTRKAPPRTVSRGLLCDKRISVL